SPEHSRPGNGSTAVLEERLGNRPATSPDGNDVAEPTPSRQRDVRALGQPRQPSLGPQALRAYGRDLRDGPSPVRDDEVLACAHASQQLAGAVLQVAHGSRHGRCSYHGYMVKSSRTPHRGRLMALATAPRAPGRCGSRMAAPSVARARATRAGA